MSNVSIFEKKWLDLVFEGKNQEYGAYKLRQESSKTTVFALLFGVSFLLGGTFLLSSFTTTDAVIPPPDEPYVVHVSGITSPVKPETPSKPKTATPIKKQNQAVKKNQNFVVAATPQAETEIPQNVELPKSNTPTGTDGGEKGTPQSPGTTSDGGGVFIAPKPINYNPVAAKELDKQPAFPGGIKSFYEYVGSHFEKQEIEQGETIRVEVSFVIEKNGAMTDIKVLQKTTPEVDAEAIRVLKSLKTKWTPGYKDGEPVRTQFTLPISVLFE